MELVELLDKIDETAPKSCQTCKFMSSCNELCNGCLSPADEDGNYPYNNWTPGNWLREIQAAEEQGRRAIVIGGQGEADFYATNSPKSVAKHLHYVAEQCGYVCSYLRHSGNETRLQISTHEGEFEIVWVDNKLKEIIDLADGSISWPNF